MGLKKSDFGRKIRSDGYNTFAYYAEDVSVFSSTTTELQELIDICEQYAQTWRLSVGLEKTKCMIYGFFRIIVTDT